MKSKTYELDHFIFSLNSTEKRNSLLLSGLFRQGKVADLISRPSESINTEARYKWQALDLVSRARSYFHPVPSERAQSLFRAVGELERQGFYHLSTVKKAEAIELCLENELYEILLAHTDPLEDEELQDLAWEALGEIKELNSVIRHVKKWMRHENQVERELALAPLLDGKLKNRPKRKRAQRLFASSRFRVLIFLKRYADALNEANAILEFGGLDQRESLQLISAAINLKMTLGEKIDQDLAKFWLMDAPSKEIRAVRLLEFVQIEWLLFAVRGEIEPGARAFVSAQNLVLSDLSTLDDPLLGASFFWGLHWALLSGKRVEFEDLVAIISDRLKRNPKCFEWVLIAIICHLLSENEVGDLEYYSKMLAQVKVTITAGMVIKMTKVPNHRLGVLNYLRQEASHQPDRERNYLDLGDFLRFLETSSPVIPRRTNENEDGDQVTALV